MQVRFNVKHQTPEENQLLLDMWTAVSAQWWGERCAAVGLAGQVSTEAPVGIMVSLVVWSKVMLQCACLNPCSSQLYLGLGKRLWYHNVNIVIMFTSSQWC